MDGNRAVILGSPARNAIDEHDREEDANSRRQDLTMQRSLALGFRGFGPSPSALLRHLIHLSFLALISRAAANTVIVQVGGQALIFTHASVSANISDNVVFRFGAGNHSVVQSSFEKPCEPLPNGFNSGFLVAEEDGQFNPVSFMISITQSEPIYYYCAQPGHCQAGMVGTINAPYDDAHSFGNFSAAAAKASSAVIPATVGGGVWVDAMTSPAWTATATAGASEAVTSPPAGAKATTTTTTTTASGSGSGSGTMSSAPTASQTGAAWRCQVGASLQLTVFVVLAMLFSS